MKKDLPRLPGGAVHRQQRGGPGANATQRGDELGAGPREARVDRAMTTKPWRMGATHGKTLGKTHGKTLGQLEKP